MKRTSDERPDVNGVLKNTTYTLDDNGNMTAMTDNTGSTTWVYDANNRVTREARTQNGVTKTVSYTYYGNGLHKTLTTFANQTVTFHYDAAHRLISQTDPKNSGGTISYDYDSRSRRTSVTYPSGVSQQQPTTRAIASICSGSKRVTARSYNSSTIIMASMPPTCARRITTTGT